MVNPPEIWWQELPQKCQSECRKKARDYGYRPASKKRLLEAEKRVQLILNQLDHHFKAQEKAVSFSAPDESIVEATVDDMSVKSTTSPGDVSLKMFCNETTFDSMQVFLGDTSASSISSVSFSS